MLGGQKPGWLRFRDIHTCNSVLEKAAIRQSVRSPWDKFGFATHKVISRKHSRNTAFPAFISSQAQRKGHYP